MMTWCKICLRPAIANNLCAEHNKLYRFDKAINGYRLRKRNNGSATRYIFNKYHKHEIELTKILERYYGPSKIVTGYHPLWAVSKKGALLEYDIFIPDKGILIEYNGEGHYKIVPIFNNKTKLKEQKQRDKLKARLAKTNKLTLIVFKYNEPLLEDYIITKIRFETEKYGK